MAQNDEDTHTKVNDLLDEYFGSPVLESDESSFFALQTFLACFLSKKSGSNVRCRSPIDSPVYVRLSSAQKFWAQVAHYKMVSQFENKNYIWTSC